MKLFSRIVQEIKNVIYELRVRFARVPDKVNYDVPYVCQFAKPEHAELSLKEELAAADDPHWQDTGATSPERYSQWAFTMCGMASTAMALGYFKNNNTKAAELAEDALKSGVYVEEGDGVISSMRYKEFVKWIKNYGLKANIYTRLGIKGIQYALAKNKLVIVSVNPNIRGYNTAPENQKGGHLVLVVGYDLLKSTIIINNPSGFVSTNTQINHELPVKEFLRYYAGRGIVISI